MDIFKSQFIFTKQATNALDADVVEKFSSYTKVWHLYNWEDGLLFQIFPVSSSSKLSLSDLEDVAEIVTIMRGENKDIVQFSVDEVSGLNIDGLYNDDLNVKRLVRTIYYCLNNNDIDLAIATRESMDQLFVEKKDDNVFYTSNIFLLRIYLCLFSYYFSHAPEELSHFIFANSYVVVLMQMGFDLEKIVMDYNDTKIVFNNRMVFCLELAASLSENESFVGVDINGQSKTIKYWIDNFRIYSKKSFDGTSLLNFISEKNYFGRCTASDKEVITQIFQLYTHLINGFLAVPDGDLNVVNVWAQNLEKNNFSDDIFGYFKITENMNKNKPVEYNKTQKVGNIVEDENDIVIDANAVRLIISSEFGYFPDDQYPDVDLVLKRLAELAVNFNNPKILEMYYYDEKENKFRWSL